MWLNCNLGKVNLELMLPAVSPTLRMICGAPSEFTGVDHLQLCSLAIVADQCLCLRFFVFFFITLNIIEKIGFDVAEGQLITIVFFITIFSLKSSFEMLVYSLFFF